MRTLLSILVLLSASQAEASVSALPHDDEMAMLHPVSAVDPTPMIVQDNNDSCDADPMVLFLRLPDGRIQILGVLKSKSSC